jgi:CDP-paratose 2-epimerase
VALDPTPTLGIMDWFLPGEHEKVEAVLSDMRELGIEHLRTGFSWAEWFTDGGHEWFDWLLPRLSREVSVLPCFTYTPPSLGVEPKTSAPPRDPKAYADFLDMIITRLGQNFEWVELWNEPNNINDWDWRLDPEWKVFSDMMGSAAYWARQRGKKVALGGMCPTDANWIRLMCKRGLMEYVDAVGVHGFPGTWEHDWTEWSEPIGKVRTVLERYGYDPEIWITEGGYSTWRFDEYRQLQEFVTILEAPAERVYWYQGYDLHPELPHQDGFHVDERHYHFGLKQADGKAKLLFRRLRDTGIEGVRELAGLGAPPEKALGRSAVKVKGKSAQRRAAVASGGTGAKIRTGSGDRRPVLITGGAGFVGTNLAHRLLSDGVPVLVFDNLSRPGVEENVLWLREAHGEKLQVEVADVRDPYAVRDAVRRARQVYHFAAQVAVTTSLVDPLADFRVNLRGTLNLLDALRGLAFPPPLVFTSTNKVYGNLEDLEFRENGSRYQPADVKIREHGICEARALDFHTPYGCSKGAADQYVLDFARSFGLSAAVLRMSCIYGPHQFGTEDQGWVAHFVLKALAGEPISVFGDGFQVRDVLFVDDLVDAMLLAQERIADVSGHAYNIGGGPRNAISLLDLIDLIEEVHGDCVPVRHEGWRTGDQKYFVSDTRRFREITGWQPAVDIRRGVSELYDWLTSERKGRIPGPIMQREAV